jgi:hypothetical protein
MMIQYDEVFPEVRQRVAAFKYWQEFWKGRSGEYRYGTSSEEDYLDDAYRFLYTSASKDFMEFCAKKEGMTVDEYCDSLGVYQGDLIFGEED